MHVLPEPVGDRDEAWVVEYGTDPVRFEQDLLALGMTPTVPELDSNLPSG